MKIFISGGCKSGKSLYAERLSQEMRKKDTPLYYLATMIAADKEDDARIARHRLRREGCGFETIETGRDILTATRQCDVRGTFLLDSVTALLANEMFAPNGSVEHSAYKKVADHLTELLGRVDDIVIVSDFIYSDAFLYDDLTEAYRRGLAYIDKQIARLSDVVLEFCAGYCISHKGAELIAHSGANSTQRS